jgi:hypothetical protein
VHCGECGVDLTTDATEAVCTCMIELNLPPPCLLSHLVYEFHDQKLSPLAMARIATSVQADLSDNSDNRMVSMVSDNSGAELGRRAPAEQAAFSKQAQRGEPHSWEA